MDRGPVGTNAIGTALAEAAPVQLFSAEHFEQAQHPWYCTAARSTIRAAVSCSASSTSAGRR